MQVIDGKELELNCRNKAQKAQKKRLWRRGEQKNASNWHGKIGSVGKNCFFAGRVGVDKVDWVDRVDGHGPGCRGSPESRAGGMGEAAPSGDAAPDVVPLFIPSHH